ETTPKPSMPLPDGETLLAKTAARALALPGVGELITVTNREYYTHTRDAYSGLRARVPKRASFLLEPFGRNTGPAVALAALWVESTIGENAVLLVLPADHLVRKQRAFAAAVTQAAQIAATGSLVTFGIAPAYPETGFGYIECGKKVAKTKPPAFDARRFVEKPALARAKKYLDAGNYLWNSGMFCFTAHAIVAAFERHAPEVLASVRPVARALASAGDGPMLEIDAKLFERAADISLDYAVMEKAAEAGEVVVVRGSFDWNDIGSWQAVAD